MFHASDAVKSPRSNFWGKLILELRLEQDLSQRTLARGAKVNRSTLRRIEEGTSMDDIRVIEKVLTFLGYELDAVSSLSKEEVLRRRAVEANDPATRSRVAFQRLLRIDMTKNYFTLDVA